VTDAGTPVAVLDASALLAFVYGEVGSHRVRQVIGRGAVISTVNWAEALSDMAERGQPTDLSASRVGTAVAAVGSLAIVPFDEAQAIESARLRASTQSLGLSPGDRACLALGRLRRLPVLTTDRTWRSLHISVRIEVIR
jgi:PIN domain nuclease of toxin-antitoxin system